MSGEDAHLFTADAGGRRWWMASPVDVGLVGDVVEVEPQTVQALLDGGCVPVVATVARGEDAEDGEIYNVNADTAAAALAAALGAEKLVVLTDVEGLYADWPNSDEVISSLDAAALEALLPTLSAGMVPKMEACLRAVRGGVPQAHVLDGRVPHSAAAGSVHGRRNRDDGDAMTTLDTVDLAARRAAAIMGNYAPPALHLVRGEGSRVWDADGSEYLDLLGGIAVSGLGHGHPAVVEAVTRQIGLLAHTSNLYGNSPSLQLAEKLIELLDLAATPARVFFCNSGAEANEAALKIARAHRPDRNRRRRGGLPRPDDRGPVDYRSAGEAGPVRAAAAGRHVRPVR